MYSYKYNEKMWKEWVVNHSKDYGSFCGELFMLTPKIYLDFAQGFMEAINEPRKNTDDKGSI